MTTIVHNEATIHPRIAFHSPRVAEIVRDAYAILAVDSHLRCWRDRLSIELVDGALRIRGRLPSYFLKQMLQERLRVLNHQIINETTVAAR